MAFGLQPTGFVPKTIDDVLGEIESDEQTNLGADIDLSSESAVGQLNAIVAPKLVDLWQLAQTVYNARVPNGASFTALDDLCGITGTTRLAATKGTVTLSVTLNAGVTLPAGSVASVPGQPSNLWITNVAVTNSGGAPAVVTVAATAQNAGSVPANAGTITQISSPVPGWTAVTNAADATPGTDQETDVQLRARRQTELAAPGSSTVASIEADVLAMRDTSGNALVATCVVQENTSAYVDSLGRDPHTIEVIVQWLPGVTGAALTAARTQLANLLWNTGKPAGIEMAGTMVQTVTDSLGIDQLVRWTEPTGVPIYVTITVSTNSAFGGAATVQNAIKAYGDTLPMGGTVIAEKVKGAAIAVAGVLDITAFAIDRVASPTSSTNVVMGSRELATFDTANISVTVT